ncbi:MAG: PfkB family carbohydrate kinase [Thermoguttaceae bacterium]
MSLLVIGSTAFDSIQTPTETRENILGGSATFASYAASFFGGVRLVSVVGDDWPSEITTMFQKQGIDTAGLEIVPGGKTFRWVGKYFDNMNDRETLETHLNVLGEFQPKLPESYKKSSFVFLANGTPTSGMQALDQVQKADLIVADTMDLWINIARSDLDALMQRIDGLVLNDSEAKLLTGERNTISAGRSILKMGPKFVVVKKGEHGAFFVSEKEMYVIPAFPTERVVDPTGAGDSFTGAMMGYLASTAHLDAESIKKALVYGTLVASFCVEGFSLDRFKEITRRDIDLRLEHFRSMTSF